MINNTFQKPITGIHVLGELYTDELIVLKNILLVKTKTIEFIARANLKRVGVSEHIFTEGGYTFVILLAESHVSIHTWPELNYATLDVFVCNVLKNNSDIAISLFDSITQLFNPNKINKREVVR